MIEIDGSIGEGGGQMLRTSLTMSSILKKPVRIFNIRAKRDRPGLRPQHFTVVNALAKITSAEVEGEKVGSTELIFKPCAPKAGEYGFDIGTAGSVCLLSQSLLPVLVFSGESSKLKLKGGTHVQFAPNYDYLSKVFLPAVSLMGCKVSPKLLTSGFYAKGGGEVEFEISPSSRLNAHQFTKRKNEQINCKIVSQNLPEHIMGREKGEVKKQFPEAEFKMVNSRGPSAGNAITLHSGFLGSSSLGKIGKPAERVAKEACDEIKHELSSGAAVDRHLSDQLLLYMALAKGTSALCTSEITSHAKTNISVLEEFIESKFQIDEERKEISIEGIAHENTPA